MDDINALLVGYGYAGKTFHAPLLRAARGIRLAAVVSSRAESVLQDLPDVKVFATTEEAYGQSEIDLVVIATPNDTHFDLAANALNAGKNVVVDKPFTTTVEEARSLIKIAERAGRHLSVFHNRRWDGDFLTLRKLMQQGTLGEIVYFESHFDRYRPEVRQRWREAPGPGGGLWYDLGAHLLDQCVQLFGPPQAIFADLCLQRDNATAVDYFHSILRYGRTRAVLHGSALVPAEGPRFIVHGTHGSFIKYGMDTQEDALKSGRNPRDLHWGKDERPGTLTLWRNQMPTTEVLPGLPGDYVNYFEGVRESIVHGAPLPVTAEEALQVMQLIEDGVSSNSQRTEISVAATMEPAI